MRKISYSLFYDIINAKNYLYGTRKFMLRYYTSLNSRIRTHSIQVYAGYNIEGMGLECRVRAMVM